jgi:hypothetical protein
MILIALMLIIIFVPVILITCIGLILESFDKEELLSMGIEL